jgi:dihydropteroate synthase
MTGRGAPASASGCCLRSRNGRDLELGGGRTRLMGVVNVTPDSFADGGRCTEPAAAAAHGAALARAGAAVIDIGGESTRPGHTRVPAAEQIRRVLPALEALRGQIDVPISIDTTLAEVASAALAAGADWVNDVSALRGDPRMARVVADAGCPIVLMHSFAPPRRAPAPDPIEAIEAGLRERLAAAARAGIAAAQILLDPGIGFGTLPQDNVTILARISRLRDLGRPLVVGPSRKSFLGHLTGKDVSQRLMGTAACVAALALAGIELVRVHDVEAMVDVVTVSEAIAKEERH